MMPHCSKCGKMPNLGIKRLLKSFGQLLEALFHFISNLLKARNKKQQVK